MQSDPIEHSAAALRALALRWMEEIWQPGDFSTFDQLHAPAFEDRSPAGRNSGRDAYRAGISELFAAFPDFRTVTEDLVVDPAAGKVAVRWSAAGTHRGPFMGFAPTGRLVRFAGIEILEIRDGQIQARWGEWDGLDILEQLRG